MEEAGRKIEKLFDAIGYTIPIYTRGVLSIFPFLYILLKEKKFCISSMLLMLLYPCIGKRKAEILSEAK